MTSNCDIKFQIDHQLIADYDQYRNTLSCILVEDTHLLTAVDLQRRRRIAFLNASSIERAKFGLKPITYAVCEFHRNNLDWIRLQVEGHIQDVRPRELCPSSRTSSYTRSDDSPTASTSTGPSRRKHSCATPCGARPCPKQPGTETSVRKAYVKKKISNPRR